MLSDYYRGMATLLVDNKRKSFEESNPNEMNYVARSLTLNAIRELDGIFTINLRPLARWNPWLGSQLPDSISYMEDTKSKEGILKFLYESKLLGYCQSPDPARIELDPDKLRKVASEINLQGANLQGVNLREIGSDLCGINLSGVHLDRANASNLILTLASLSRSDLRKSDFSNTTLTRADFSGSDLQGVTVNERTTAKDANFNDASLCFADLSSLYAGSTTSKKLGDTIEAQLNSAKFDTTTKLPKILERESMEKLYETQFMLGASSRQLSEKHGARPLMHRCDVFSVGS